MGMFDYALIDDPRFTCSEGHDLSDAKWQTKDFACVLGDVLVGADGSVSFAAGYGDHMPGRSPWTGVAHFSADCKKCPAFVQAKTANLCSHSVDYAVAIEADRIVWLARVSETSAEFVEREPKRPWMVDCLGPMTYDEAMAFHIKGIAR